VVVRYPASVLTALLLISCSEAHLERGNGEPLYQADTMVLEAEGQVRLCLGGVMESLPPQCDGVPVIGWSWDEVEGENESGGVTWGEYHVVGTYDGSAFTLTRSGPPREAAEGDNPFAPPCPEPEGGWVTVDPSLIGDDARVAAMRVAEDSAGYAGLWIDYLDRPEDGGTREYVLTVAFTGDPTDQEAAIRQVYGGPLCLTAFDHTFRELRRVQRDLSDGGAEKLGLQLTWSDIDMMHNNVEVGAVVTDSSIQAGLDSEYGPGVVEVHPALRPV
jgi:hypothetical protein